MRCLFCIFVVIIGTSCHRTEIHHKIRFKGTAIDQYTHYPIQNASIQVWEEYNHPNGSSDQSVAGGGETDGNGNFDFETSGIHKDTYTRTRYLLFIGPAVNISWYSGRFFIGDVENTNEYAVELYTLSRLRFLLVNATPFDQNDAIHDLYIERPWGQQQLENNGTYTGMNVNAELWSTYYGYASSVLHYSVTKNGNTQNYTDTIFTPDPFSDVWVTDTIQY